MCPASKVGVRALKPTVDVTSRAGIIPVSPNQDSVGPMAMSVRDIAHLLNVLVGPDKRDPNSIEAAEVIRADWTSNFDGLRIGVLSPEWFMKEDNISYG